MNCNIYCSSNWGNAVTNAIPDAKSANCQAAYLQLNNIEVPCRFTLPDSSPAPSGAPKSALKCVCQAFIDGSFLTEDAAVARFG